MTLTLRVTLGLTRAGVMLGLRSLAWLIEARGLANGSEGSGQPGPIDRSEGFRWAGLVQGPLIKVRALGGRAGPQALSINVRGTGGQAGRGPANGSEGFWGYWPGPAGPPSLANPTIELPDA